MRSLALVCGFWVTVVAPAVAVCETSAPTGGVPKSVESLWACFDPRQEPLDTKTVREWVKNGTTFRYVTFHVGTFKGVKARMAAFYAFPSHGRKTPGLLHLHGGGQRASLQEVAYYAERGYACLSINWGGREMDEAKPGDPNTDWGAVDPTQQNVPGYFNLQPGPKYIDPIESPRNNNWYLLTLGARRGLTFLEGQPQVDPDRLGVYGHSMGGNLAVYVAATDNRVKAAAPSVGGSGFRTYPWPFLPELKKQLPNGDLQLYRATLEFESHAPLVRTPLLWLGATNDFHGIMDDTYRTGALIPHQEVRYAFTPHMNHRFTPEFAVDRLLWFDQHLMGTFTFPATPTSKLVLTADRMPRFQVTPDVAMPVAGVNIFYSLDPHPQARFWRSADAVREENTWTASLPIMALDQPLFAFANVHYPLKPARTVPYAQPTDRFAVSSLMDTATPEQLRQSGVKATDTPSLMIDDFSHGWRDWYMLSPDNPHHWQFWTRKISDLKWRGRPGYRLAFDVQSQQANLLVVVLTENFFRSYRGPQQDFVAVVELEGGDHWQTVTLSPGGFQSAKGEGVLRSWANADLLGFRAYYDEAGRALGSKTWKGPQPRVRNLRWVQDH